MSGVYVCSLSNKLEAQVVPADGKYHILRFPFGVRESYDKWQMHEMKQPDGYVIEDWHDPRSGLIWPKASGWATVTSMIHWGDGDYTVVKDQFCRDPLGLTQEPDTTATQSHLHLPGWLDLPLPGIPKGWQGSGKTYVHGTHQLFVHPGIPIGVRVTHNSDKPLKVEHAQFKMCIHRALHPGQGVADDESFPSAEDVARAAL